jgi:flagellar hook-basal body complex protein FliE
MEITSIGSKPIAYTAPEKGKAAPPVQAFADFMSQALDQVDQLQKGADLLAQRLAAGESVDIHDVALAISQSQIALELSVQVRNKLIEAYQEIMRMQV